MLLPNIVATAALLSTLIAGIPLLDERPSNAMMERRTPPGEPVKKVVKWIKKKIQPPGGARVAPISFPALKGPKRRSADPEPEPAENPIKWVKKKIQPKGGGKITAANPFSYPLVFVPKRRSAQPEPGKAFDGPVKKSQRRSAEPQSDLTNTLKWIKKKIVPKWSSAVKPFPRVYNPRAKRPGERRSAKPEPDKAFQHESVGPQAKRRTTRRSTSTEPLHQRPNIKKRGASKAPIDI
ncbi:hypothetical protein HYALB_00005654 [Hymenoscyphus albidus]|uniref:Uncharacterized protein n=1 Tax=Hymenoscyphus albidus TaxID=595503 RepID=A0A9N9LN23_9HELO|nr:hypothetical protein HYALB_00005654 [Hymenoscyphus albidus]